MTCFISNPTYFVSSILKHYSKKEFIGLQQATQCTPGPKKGQDPLVPSLKTAGLVNNSQASAEQQYAEEDVASSRYSINRPGIKGNGEHKGKRRAHFG